MPELRARDEKETWPGTVDKLRANNITAIEAFADSKSGQVSALSACKEVSAEALQELSMDRLHPSLMDVFLRWITKLSGARFWDANGIHHIQSRTALDQVTAEWPGVEAQRYAIARNVVASRDISQKLRAKKNESVIAPLVASLKGLKLPLNLCLVDESRGRSGHDSGGAGRMAGAVVTVSSTSTTVPVKHLQSERSDWLSLSAVLEAAGFKKIGNGKKLAHTTLGKQGEGDWAVLSRAVTNVFGADSGAASATGGTQDTHSKLLRLLVLHQVWKLCAGAGNDSGRPDGGGSQGDGGAGGGGGSPPSNGSKDAQNGNHAGGAKGKRGHKQGTTPAAPAPSPQSQRSDNTIPQANIAKPYQALGGPESEALAEGDEPQSDEELSWKSERDAVLADVDSAYRRQGGSLDTTMTALIDRILLEYQQEGSNIVSLISATPGRGGVLTVLCRYTGANRNVVVKMYPGEMFELWISDFRKKERWHNDRILRHAAIWMESDRRTVHSPSIRQLLAQPLRLFKHGTFVGFASLNKTQSADAEGMTFMATKHFDARFKAVVRERMRATDDAGNLVLSDELRRCVQRLTHAVSAFNRYGLALGDAAINDVRVDAQGNPVFSKLWGSSIFPADKVCPSYSQQAINTPPFLPRCNTSASWDPSDPVPNDGKEVTIHRLDANRLKDSLSNQKRRGAAALKDCNEILMKMTTTRNGKVIEKNDAYWFDQRSLALMIADVMCYPTEPQLPHVSPASNCSHDCAELCSILRGPDAGPGQSCQTWRAEMKKRLQEKFRTSLEKAAIAFCDETVIKSADWVLESFAPNAETSNRASATNPASALAYHPFLTTFFFTPIQWEALCGQGILIGPEVVATGPYMSAACKFVGQRLPAVCMRVQKGKGVGLEAGQDYSDKDLIGIYFGECVVDTDELPASRMVLKLTSNKERAKSWAYCFGAENFETCKSVPALFSYANSPNVGEVANCRVDRDQECRYTASDGKLMSASPVYAVGRVLKGAPLLWPYSHISGPGVFI